MKPSSAAKSLSGLWFFSRQLLAGLVDLIYPPECLLCRQAPAQAGAASLCPECVRQLAADAAATCPRCAATVGPHAATADGCPQCAREVFHFKRVFRLGRYEGKRREAILTMKHQPGEALAEALGQLWAECRSSVLTPHRVDVVVPVPLHWLRWWQRGYNQSEAVARVLARALRKPCRTRWLWRRRHTPPQTTQSPTDRRRQMRGSFRAALPKRLRGATILLVDDVLTTGSTCSEAARALRDAGAAHVFVAVIARAES